MQEWICQLFYFTTTCWLNQVRCWICLKKRTSKNFWISYLLCKLELWLKFLEACLSSLVPSWIMIWCLTNCGSSSSILMFVTKKKKKPKYLNSLKRSKRACFRSRDKLTLMKIGWAFFPSSARLNSINALPWSLGWSGKCIGVRWTSIITTSSSSSRHSYSWGPISGRDVADRHKTYVIWPSVNLIFSKSCPPGMISSSQSFNHLEGRGGLADVEAIVGFDFCSSRSSHIAEAHLEVGL